MKFIKQIASSAIAVVISVYINGCVTTSYVDNNNRFIADQCGEAASPFEVAQRVLHKDQLPKWHPAHGLEKGDYIAINGTIVSRERSLDHPMPLMAGLSKSYIGKIGPILQKLDQDRLSEKESYKLRQELLSFLAEYYGKNLSSDKKRALRELYIKSSKIAPKIHEEFSKKSITLDDAYEKLAIYTADFVVEEMKLFAGNEKAQSMRYRYWRAKSFPNSDKVKNLLKKANFELYSGKYLQRDKKITGVEQKLFENPEKNAKDITSLVGKAIFKDSFLGVTKLDPSKTSTYTEETIYTSETLWYEARVYTAEHSIISDPVENELEIATGWDWEVIAGDTGLVHVSVVAGIWEIKKEHVLVTTKVSPTGQALSTKKMTRWREKFRSWEVGNGSASWVHSDDTLFLKMLQIFSTYEAAKKWIKGQTPTSGGKYYPMRSCSYSIGLYGLNWVCHQNSNSFAKRKWNLVAVGYATNVILDIYSTHPMHRISRRKDPFWGTCCLKGGLAGEALYYHLTPPWSEPSAGGALTLLMDSSGYGLDTRWNPKKNAWKSSGCDYKSAWIPIVGPSRMLWYEEGWI